MFSELYKNAKAKKNVKTFSDIEHLAYRLFSENENIRNEYSLKYNEILIDEYQDTNGLQDSIFTLISRDNKNMFMVGDLKQSIYRFRGGDAGMVRARAIRRGHRPARQRSGVVIGFMPLPSILWSA